MMKKTKGQFGLRLAELRRSRGWTQGELAEKAELSQTYVADLEQGTRRFMPRLDIAAKLARALGVPIESLLQPSESAERHGPGRPKEKEE